jgi:radical SAM protein with 4Fe4S-binding SPASM domain
MVRTLINYMASRPRLRVAAQRSYARISRNVRLLPPVGVAVELTYACNWRCKMCFHHRPAVHDAMVKTLTSKKAEELSIEELKALVDEIAAMGVKHLSLHGGEPLIRPDFCELLEYAAGKGLHTSTFTNATLITEEVAACLVKHLCDVGISIHGAEGTHDAVTGVPGSFQKAVAGVQRLQEAKRRTNSAQPVIHLVCIVSRWNHEHLDEMVNVARQVGLTEFAVGLTTFTSREAEEATLKLTGARNDSTTFLGDSLIEPETLQVDPVRYRQAVDRLQRAAHEAGIKASAYNFRSEEEIMLAFADPFFRFGRRCDYPWLSSLVSAYGDVYPCVQFSFLGFNMGNIRQIPFPKIWRGHAYRQFRSGFARNRCYLPACAKCCFVLGEQ